MKTIHNFQDLQQYGVNVLTGEACRLSMRMLCDVNEDGQRLLVEFFGVQLVLPANWNSQVNNKPAIGSIMLTPSSLWEIARFAMLHVDQFDYVIECIGLRGFNHDNKYAPHYVELAQRDGFEGRFYLNHAKGVGSRNTHAFTGRTV